MKLDLRDQGNPIEKEWLEFRAGYAAVRLFALLLGDLGEIAPDYVPNLRRRLSEGISIGEGNSEEDPASDGPALIPGPLSGEPTMMDLSEALLLEEQLFPDRRRHDTRDFHQATRGMVIVAFHSVLESFAKTLGATKKGTSLPKAIGTFLSAKAPEHQLPSALAHEFVAFNETRVVIVHNRGIVNDTYARKVEHNMLQVGELRHLTASDVSKYAETTWKVGTALALATSS